MSSVSVIMPVYNCAAYLDRAVTPVCSQSRHDWELIIAVVPTH